MAEKYILYHTFKTYRRYLTRSIIDGNPNARHGGWFSGYYSDLPERAGRFTDAEIKSIEKILSTTTDHIKDHYRVVSEAQFIAEEIRNG